MTAVLSKTCRKRKHFIIAKTIKRKQKKVSSELFYTQLCINRKLFGIKCHKKFFADKSGWNPIDISCSPRKLQLKDHRNIYFMLSKKKSRKVDMLSFQRKKKTVNK